MANGVAGVDSEQNFQSRAHNRVKRQSRLNASGKARIGVFTFHFRTTWVDNGAAFATRVVYYTADANNVADNSNYQKRGLVSGEVVTYDYFDNGTESMSSRPFTELEVMFMLYHSSYTLTCLVGPARYDKQAAGGVLWRGRKLFFDATNEAEIRGVAASTASRRIGDPEWLCACAVGIPY